VPRGLGFDAKHRPHHYDTSGVESFFAILRLELLDQQCWNTRQQLELAIFDWIESCSGVVTLSVVPSEVARMRGGGSWRTSRRWG
jgi:Integrase core domain